MDNPDGSDVTHSAAAVAVARFARTGERLIAVFADGRDRLRPTDQQLRLLIAIAQRTERRRGIPPTHPELASDLGRCTQRIGQHLDKLELNGWITRDRRRARTLQLTSAGLALLSRHGREQWDAKLAGTDEERAAMAADEAQ
jgi:DNA-binding MarR family transcriptional regulator